MFEKTSTRTRCAFEVAAFDQGAHVTYLGPEGSQIGHKESMKDTARVEDLVATSRQIAAAAGAPTLTESVEEGLRASTTCTPTCGSRWTRPRKSGTSASSC